MALSRVLPRANLRTVLLAPFATYKLPLESTASASGWDKPVEYVALTVVLPGANLTTVLIWELATYRLPLESTSTASGSYKPAEYVTTAVVLPGPHIYSRCWWYRLRWPHTGRRWNRKPELVDR